MEWCSDFFSYSLQICKLWCLDFSTCHCIMLQQPICGIAKSCAFSKTMGCLWNNCFNFVPNCFVVVFWTKLLDTSCLQMPCNLSYSLVKIFVKSGPLELFLTILLKNMSLIMNWRSSWSEWSNKFYRFFYPLFIFCMYFTRKKIIIC